MHNNSVTDHAVFLLTLVVEEMEIISSLSSL